ncbi:Na-translocating system protein MpsC family protein [Patulibacter sp.]|uniref:Na-translocating system protein MpsC family protein n=1 Tax=Patulibacter sp. TaxID=1912859 RepID=UPI002727D01A|nr:Na-translocating system protein MpsC family protein [Patulibacter sp.]MDO9410853.1 Na-translocating system protein MpsC family protein [Patulibacter sp.]
MTVQDRPPSTTVEIADGIARVYKARYGRGPLRIDVHVAGDAVVCVLRGVNTPAQRSLVEYDHAGVAQAVHERLQTGMAPEMEAVVERATGRAVGAYVPGFNARADATTDTFLLEPVT